MKGISSPDQYIQSIRSISNELAFSGHVVDECTPILTLIHGLGPQYHPFMWSKNANLDHLTFDDLVAQSRTYEATLIL